MPAPDSCSFFSGYLLFREEKSSSRFEAEVVAGHSCKARYPVLNVADRPMDFTPLQLQEWLSMTANAAAVPGLVISATTEYLTNNYHTQTALEV